MARTGRPEGAVPSGNRRSPDQRELLRLEGDLLDLSRLGLPCAGWYEKRQRQQDGCPRELAEYNLWIV